MITKKDIEVKKKVAGWYQVYLKTELGDGTYHSEFIGEVDKNGSETGEWVVFDADNEWIITTDVKWFAIQSLIDDYNNRLENPHLYS
jgi:hypothetical protein